ncbi:hypothetical protein HD806DRAFT_514512 [Xylariaceae sp. AK1471]|nr:hypothetical protein HD806DRAFT_514512 [Xylariaceae sp. AK1471]
MDTDPYHTPALHPPDGVEPKFRDYYPVKGSQVALATVLLALCAGGVLARSYTRARILKQFDLSDWALILALLFFVAFTALKLVANTYGQGYHQWDVNIVTVKSFLLISNLVETLYCPTMLFAKYTVLRQIEVIFYKHQYKKGGSRIIWGLIWANSIFYVSIFFTFLFACIPRAKISNPSLEGHCIDAKASILATSAINVVSDTTILIIPLVAVWQLQLRPRAKFGISIVFAVGIFATIACIVRLYYGIELARSEDATWLIEGVGTWAIVEFATVILVACFPLFPRLYKQLLKHDKHLPFESAGAYRCNKKKPSHLSPRAPTSDGGDGSSTIELCQM